VKEDYPKLGYNTTFDSLHGHIDIFSDQVDYLDTFKVSIKIPLNYPNGVPVVRELSNIIVPRGDDRHISLYGEMCLDIPHKLELLALKGLTLRYFIHEVLRPYLVNQCYYNIEGKFAGETYDHGTKGIIQFYKEDLELSCPKIILKLIEAVRRKEIYSKRAFCPCGSRKGLQYCHINQVKVLKKISRRQLDIDKIAFSELLD
jgi:hypothetical protein